MLYATSTQDSAGPRRRRASSFGDDAVKMEGALEIRERTSQSRPAISAAPRMLVQARRLRAVGIMVADKELYAQPIADLVEDFDGYTTLARVLNVNVDELHRWSEGRGRPPADVFFRMLNLATRKVVSR
jgi:hypothetical protein